MKIIRRIIIWFLASVFFLFIMFAFYSNSLLNVNQKTINYYDSLKKELVNKGYKLKVYVISGKRFRLFNLMLTKYGNAVKNSRHLKGEAIDIIVLDINEDGESDETDVNIVYEILDKKIIKSKGGIGMYKNQTGFFTRQMVHFDCRGYKARWNR